MTGTPCKACGVGWLVVYSVYRRGDVITRYHWCWQCAHVPEQNKQTVTKPKRKSRVAC